MRKKLLFLIPCIVAFIGTINAQNALNFDGVNDFVQTNYSGVLASQDRTFEAWVYVSSTAPTANLTILDYGLNAAGSRNTFLIDANRGLRFISGGTNGNLPASTTTIASGQWFHVAFVLDNGTGYLYVNGTQSSTGNLSGVNTPSGNADLTIGQRVSGGSIPFAGKIDEVRIWDVARTQAEIMANMNSELCSNPSSLKAYYKMNQGLASGNNAGLTNVIGELGDTAIANNFAMTGVTSNWDTGAAINQIIPLDLNISLDTLNQTLSSADTSTNVRYQWYDCTTNSPIIGDTNRTYSPRSNGTFAVILTKGSCTDTSGCLNTSFSSGNAPGKALDFDGVDDFVQTSFPGVLDSTNRTFEAWVNISPSAPSSNMAILDYGLNAVGSRNTFLINANRSLVFISGGTNANLPGSVTTIPSGLWVHVAFVLDNGTGYLYINGNQSSTGSLSAVNTPAGNADLTIGQRVSGGSIPFAGSIDEVRIWNVARTQAEIMANMNTEFCGPVNGLVALYNMNYGIAGGNNSSLTKVPNSANSGDGTLTNFTLNGNTSNFVAPGANINQPTIDTTVTQMGLTLTANDSTADSYQWIDCANNMILIGDTSRTFTASNNGSYAVILSKNACVDTSSCVNVISVGLEQFDFDHNFYISQNPVENTFYLVNNRGIKVNACIRSITGKLIETKEGISDSRIEFNLTKVTSGIYVLIIEGEDGSNTNFKIIKQ